MGFGLPAAYVERSKPDYTVDEDESGFQPHVYDLAGWLASMSGARRIVDIGCGKASKLVKLAERGFEIVGVDYGSNLDMAMARYPQGRWIKADLERFDPTALLDEVDGSVIVCADVIEHLVDPSALLDALRVWLTRAKVCILSTPERVLCYGKQHSGPPPNPSHVREWTRVELVHYLQNNGLSVTFSGFTQTHVDHPETGAHQGCQTTLVILRGRV